MNAQRITIFLTIFFLLTSVLSADQLFEAENAALKGVNVSKSRVGYSGAGYVTGFDTDGDQITFTVEIEPGLYELVIGYATPSGEKGYDLTVNGQKSSGMLTGKHETFVEHAAGKVLFKTGKNTIIIGKGWGWFEIDYIKVKSATVQKPLKPPTSLTDPQADPTARALFTFLVDLYGEKILSGQQDLQDINYIVSKIGKSPAIGVFDLIDYSPTRIQFGANPAGSVEKWLDWANKGGGIVSMSWHWNAPTDLINTTGKEWWRGFYTDATTFDLAKALADKNSQCYKLLLHDMDAIAEELQKFRDADMPVLWRPLHEASGGWFWWGAKGAEPFKELWRLMHDRFVNVLGLHNLIWVYTHADPTWYPGDDVVDVVSMDIYTDASSSMSGEWEGTQKLFNGKKLVILSESGTLPDPVKMRTYAVWWSWFSVWSGDFIRKADVNLLKRVYTDPDVVTLDKLPDWRQYTTVSHVSDDVPLLKLEIFPNPANPGATIRYSLPSPSDVRLEIYSILGQLVQERFLNALPAGLHSCLLSGTDLPSGTYFIRLTAGALSQQQRLILLK